MKSAARPYSDQQELVRDRLRCVRASVAACSAAARGDGSDADADAIAADLAASIEARIAATADRDAMPVTWLRSRLGLTATEERVLWLLAAQELDPTVRLQLRSLSTEDTPEVTLDVIRRVVYGAASAVAWRELSPSGRLVELVLVERTDRAGDAAATHRQTYRIAPRVLGLVHGDASLDPGLARVARIADAVVPLGEVVVPPPTLAAISAAIEAERVVMVTGGAGTGRRTALRAVACERGRRVIELDARDLASELAEMARQLRCLARDAALLAAMPLVRNVEQLAAPGDAPDRGRLLDRELVRRTSGAVLLTCGVRPLATTWSRAPVVIAVPPPSAADRARLWRSALPLATAAETDRLATARALSPALIHAAGRLVQEQGRGGADLDTAVRAALRVLLDDRLGAIATRVDTTQTWEDVVLPRDQLEAVVELLARVRQRARVLDDWGFARKVGRGLGTVALFAGPPGTGKTMVAGLVARELGLELYQVDLSRVVSKWIGETEKNLAALFDAAEAGHAVLLFDEADALFGKRTEVRSSNDRNANLEVNYLLQRLEAFTGVCILTTNHENAMDDAFRRRLSVHVRFAMPDEADRARLWRAMVPDAAPVAADVAVGALARRFAMSPGHIRNAVLRAAFLAAEEDAPLTAEHMTRGARLEYDAMGKIATG